MARFVTLRALLIAFVSSARAASAHKSKHTRTYSELPFHAVRVVACIALALASGCTFAPVTLFGKDINGTVIDATTGQPLANAQVIYLYLTAPETHPLAVKPPREICYHASGAVTGADGRFHLPAWQKPQTSQVPNIEPQGWAYARGFVPNYVLQPKGPESNKIHHPRGRTNDVFRLTRTTALGDQRFEEIWMFIRRSCDYGGSSNRDVYPRLKVAYDEAKSIATTDKQRKEVRAFARVIAAAALGFDGNSTPQGADQQIERYVDENLR